MADVSLRDQALARLVVGDERAAQDGRRWNLIGLAIIAGTIGVSVVWSTLAPLSSAVVAQGSVKVDTSRKKIQHAEGGVVKKILVQDGSTVKAGDVLVQLDETRAGAAHGMVVGGRDVALATEARLKAERDEKSTIEFPPELTQRTDNEQVAQILRAQQAMFAARRSSRAGELGILDEQVAALRNEITGFQSQQRSKNEQIESLENDLKGLIDLDKQGMVEKTRLRAVDRDIARLKGERDELVSKVASGRTAISERELKKFQVRRAFQEEVANELKKVQSENYELIERASATKRTLELTELRAPVSGTITELKIHTAGGVIGPGEVVMELVPSDDRLVLEARVLPADIDRVMVGQQAGLKLHAFNPRTTPELNGSVTYVSADAVLDPRTELSYFTVKLDVPKAELERLGEQKVQPGMQADIFIRTGERTFFGYLLQPLMDSFRKAWLER
ncbi:MAG: HlyD family type I secretion periplasmic adaptor subunit [Burkholderiaceae bacterium]|nr:HlyD family type I secretion periplasmic adaptor subunit [Burkholderiaceae bacterium]